MEKPLVITASESSSNNDFDFIMGRWRIHNRKLVKRLADCDEWTEFPAVGECRQTGIEPLRMMALRMSSLQAASAPPDASAWVTKDVSAVWSERSRTVTERAPTSTSQMGRLRVPMHWSQSPMWSLLS